VEKVECFFPTFTISRPLQVTWTTTSHLTSRFGDVLWPPRSPDLTAADFFLWEYLKAKVYVDKPDENNHRFV